MIVWLMFENKYQMKLLFKGHKCLNAQMFSSLINSIPSKKQLPSDFQRMLVYIKEVMEYEQNVEGLKHSFVNDLKKNLWTVREALSLITEDRYIWPERIHSLLNL